MGFLSYGAGYIQFLSWLSSAWNLIEIDPKHAICVGGTLACDLWLVYINTWTTKMVALINPCIQLSMSTRGSVTESLFFYAQLKHARSSPRQRKLTSGASWGKNCRMQPKLCGVKRSLTGLNAIYGDFNQNVSEKFDL